MQINGNKAGLPVMAVDQIRSEINHRQDGKGCLGKESKFLDFKERIITVGFKPVKVEFIIDEVIFYPADFRFHDPHILILPMEIHIEMRFIGEPVFHLLGHAYILRQDHPYIIVFPVNAFGQGSHHVRQSPGLNKGHAFRSHKQNFSHSESSRNHNILL